MKWNKIGKKGPPSDSLLGPHIQSICEALDIPHIETRFDIDHGAKEFSINLFPQQKKLNDAILDTVKYLNWTRYAIIYEGNKSWRKANTNVHTEQSEIDSSDQDESQSGGMSRHSESRNENFN